MPNLTVEGGGNGNGHRKVRSSSMIWKQSATNSNPSSPALSAQPARAVSPSSLAPPGVKIKRRKWQPECRPVCDRPPRVFQRAGWHFLLSWQQFRRKNKPGERTTCPLHVPTFGCAQDRGSIEYPFGNDPQQALFCVLDGHGPQGAELAQSAMLTLHTLIFEDTRLHRQGVAPSSLTDPAVILRESFMEVLLGCRRVCCLLIKRRRQIKCSAWTLTWRPHAVGAQRS